MAEAPTESAAMPQDYDVTLKKMLRESTGVFTRSLFGGQPIAEWLNVEQPQVTNRRADLLARVGPDPATGQTTLYHVELQTRNDPRIGERMLGYYVGFWDQFGCHVRQVLVYLGGERLTMSSTHTTPSTTHAYEIVNMAELDGEDLLASADWVDNELALLTRADRERVYVGVLARLRALAPPERKEAGTLFTLISGIIGVEEETKRRLDQDMIDIMENKVLGPMIQREIELGVARGRQEGWQEGRQEGEKQGQKEGQKQGLRRMLVELLEARFGPLADPTRRRIEMADEVTLTVWTKRLFERPELGIDAIVA